MDYGIHPYDIEYGLGDKLATVDEKAAGLLIPYTHIIMQNTVDQEAARGVDIVYGLEVSGPWGGKWRVTVKDGKWSSEARGRQLRGLPGALPAHAGGLRPQRVGPFPGRLGERGPGGHRAGAASLLSVLTRGRFGHP